MTGHDALAGRVLGEAAERGWTIAVAESLTGGLLCSALVAVPGASAVFRGGVVVYATDLKGELLGVAPDLLAAQGPVSSAVALEMARGARERLGADVGIATTGVAGPDAQGGVPPGVVYVAVEAPAGVSVVRALRLSGDRAEIRAESCRHALELTIDVLTRAEGTKPSAGSFSEV